MIVVDSVILNTSRSININWQKEKPILYISSWFILAKINFMYIAEKAQLTYRCKKKLCGAI